MVLGASVDRRFPGEPFHLGDPRKNERGGVRLYQYSGMVFVNRPASESTITVEKVDSGGEHGGVAKKIGR